MKLNLICSQKNSGGAGIPRNIGMKISRAEYITFVDSDDAITPTALEELYTLAKKFDADVVYCEKFYKTEIGDVFTTDKNFLTVKVGWNANYNFADRPYLMTENLVERIKDFGTRKFWTAPWNFLFRRNLIMRENIFFPNLKIGEDEIFDFKAVCLAKNILRVPNIIYIWRNHENAFSRSILPTEKYIERWLGSLFTGIGLIDEFMSTLEVCRNNSEYKYLIFESFIQGKTGRTSTMYSQIPAPVLDGLIRRELEKINDQKALTAFLFARMNIFNLQLNRQNQIIHQQYAQIQQLQAQLKALKS